MSLSKLNLHLFDGEGGEASGETSAVAGQGTGENTAVAGQDKGTEKSVDRNAEFRKLIQGEYKDLYDKEVNKILNGRLKKAKASEERLSSIDPLIQRMGARYGVDPSDVKGISDAFDKDDSYVREAAEREGLTFEQKQHMLELEYKGRLLTAKEEEAKHEQELRQVTERWKSETEELKGSFPDFDFDSEMDDNEKFRSLVINGANVGDAYFAAHKDEILSGAMQYTAQKVKEGVTNNIQARGSRPAENGSSSQAPSSVKRDPSKLTSKEMDELERRAARGEIITFT